MARIPAAIYRALSRVKGWRAIKFRSKLHPIRWLDEHRDDWWHDLKKWWRRL